MLHRGKTSLYLLLALLPAKTNSKRVRKPSCLGLFRQRGRCSNSSYKYSKQSLRSFEDLLISRHPISLETEITRKFHAILSERDTLVRKKETSAHENNFVTFWNQKLVFFVCTVRTTIIACTLDFANTRSICDSRTNQLNKSIDNSIQARSL